MNIEILSSIIDKQTADVSVLFKNLSTGTTLYEKNTHKQVRSASIIKLFILSKCADAFEKGLYSPQDILPVPPEEKVSFSLLSDLNQPSWRLDDMASLMIILSDNTATNLLIDLFNMDKINAHISGLGGDQTVLQRKMMDTAVARMGLENYTSLHDAAQLLEGIYQEASKGHVYSQWMLDVLSKQRDRSMLRRYLPESVKFSNKTGLNHEVQHDIGLFTSGNNTYLLGVFIEGQADEVNGLECIGKLAKHMYEEVAHDL